jgi:hypothetical protein
MVILGYVKEDGHTLPPRRRRCRRCWALSAPVWSCVVAAQQHHTLQPNSCCQHNCLVRDGVYLGSPGILLGTGAAIAMTVNVPKRRLGQGLEVSAVGLGCMGMTGEQLKVAGSTATVVAS